MSVNCVLLLLGKLQLEGKSCSFSDSLSTVFMFCLLEDKRIKIFFSFLFLSFMTLDLEQMQLDCPRSSLDLHV